MSRASLIRVAQIVHLLALSVWLGGVSMSGVVAAIVFPTMRQLDPTLGAYPEYQGDHALLGAGRIASRVFFTMDAVQFICACVALGTIAFMVAMGYSLNTLWRVLRVIVLCATMGLLSYYIFIFMNAQTRTLNAYWEFAAAGDTQQADQFKDLFLQSHGSASRILGAIAIMVMLNIVLSGITLTAKDRSIDRPGDGS